MKKLLDIIACIGISMFIIIIKFYVMLISSDIPVNVSLEEFSTVLKLLLLFLIVYSIYIRKTYFPILNFVFLLLPSLFWFLGMQNSLKYNYHIYTTLSYTIGFSIIIIALLQCIWVKIKSIKNTRIVEEN